jgi:hypothetical protein
LGHFLLFADYLDLRPDAQVKVLIGIGVAILVISKTSL